jgi:hypothetical protein
MIWSADRSFPVCIGEDVIQDYSKVIYLEYELIDF